MAYNPFDDVIEQDPAYMQTGGDPVYNRFGQRVFDDQSYLTDPDKVKEQIQEETRGIADVIARTAAPIAGLVTDPEGYRQTQEQRQRNEEILQQLGITNRLLNRDEMKRAKAAGYKPLTVGQVLREPTGFLYSDLVSGSEKIRAGVDYYDLPENERTGVALGLLDLVDIALIPAAFKKLATVGIRKFGEKTNLLTMAKDPELQKQFPAETQEILSITGGGFTPAGVVRDAEKGSGLASSTPTVGQSGKGTQAFLLDFFSDPKATLRTTKDLESQGISRTQLTRFLSDNPQYRSRILMNADDAKLQDQLLEGIEKLKSYEGQSLTNQELAKIFGYKYPDRLQIVLNRPKILENNILTKEQLDFINSFKPLKSKRVEVAEDRTKNIIKTLQSNPKLQNLGVAETARLLKIPSDQIQKQMNKNPELFAFISKDQKLVGTETPLLNIATVRKYFSKIDDEDYAMINNLYRGTKEKTGFTPEQFMKEFKKQNPNYGKTQYDKNAKKAYQTLNKERSKLQKEATDYFDKKLKDPRYAKYLKETDRKQFEFHKAHAFEISDATGQGRFNNMAQMSDLIFNAPAGSNLRLQQRFDRQARVIASLTDLESLKALENTSVKTPATEIDARFRLNIPALVERLKEYGIEIYPENFKNLRDLIFGKGGIKKGIEKAYKDQGLGTLIPVGDKEVALVGKNPKKVSGRQRLNLLKKRFQKILDDQVLYEKTNGKKGKPIMRQGGDETEGGFIVGLKDGGEVEPVRMAIGGDPLTNLNQQQFSPDPAFEGQDFFQEAVDSGNLQAVNLLNLFKVFKKPKVMATPSNVKQVEQARDPMPQGVPGSQQLQPLPAGKPDFFFKSYLLDQLNSPNAPKASNPQGWREFLIKGKKVPEAEMLDTGILQYLEDTEKFYPNKKITKQELEDLYDMSPLGNLEVRVKQISQPGEPGFNLSQIDAEAGQFALDQGAPKHKGAGRAAIDEQADEYFEVVVNVPTLPGQEKAFVNSIHFSEPNVLGFTRVGTYKNSNNETVAVIQEMQTDMLTEVRKEQERLFAMVNALRRERAKIVNYIQTSANPDYYKNELRLFDQKYPPSRLDALETDNLIQPFPNIVAKDLIPERTASLNTIQEQINKLAMANVEQYNDPAYKTMLFDLAQQQNKIFEDLSSMNRSSNYEETLKDFKVPVTGERDELERIANYDQYLPSSYNLKQVQSFPPIPFNKQADYVDLLIKSTIKAAKGKGIDKVAIMPADVGANPRWSKTTDEAKKKFQNLYDKVGVQQLKNIAKKYGGKLEIEKIVDPSKGTKGLTFLNKNPDGKFQVLKQTEVKKEISDADRDKYYDEEITRIASGVTEPGDVVYSREIAPGQIMDYYVIQGRSDATDVGYRFVPLKEGESADDAMIKIVEYNPSEVDMYTISFDSSQLEEPMYLFKKKSGGSIDKDSLVSITDIYGEYGR